MYNRIFKPPANSFFLFGPRGTGKSSFIRTHFPTDPYIDLLDPSVFTELLASPSRLLDRVSLRHFRKSEQFIIVDEVQKVPELLDEVHRLIESERIRFILTGSSTRKLRRSGANLLAGRAVTRYLHPLTSVELGGDFDLLSALRQGFLPGALAASDPSDFLKSYVATYLREEILAEGILRNLSAFARFLEAASFSQTQLLNVAEVAQESHVSRKVAEDYFQILEDLLLAVRLEPFTRRAKRKISSHKKFMFFDVGVFRAIRPRGVLDVETEIDGAALETLVWQELAALNDYFAAEYQISFWRTTSKLEVDFILYGPNGFFAIEVKRSHRIRPGDLDGLKTFLQDYPESQAIALYTGTRAYHDAGVDVVPLESWFGTNGECMKRMFSKFIPNL
jgi:predicted AAA+ superfamily ATPase